MIQIVSLIWLQLFLFLSLWLIIISCQTYLPESEYNALYNLYETTNGPNWIWKSDYDKYGYPWNFTMIDSDPCSVSYPWQGLNCSFPCDSSYCHVTFLNLRDYDLIGPFPSNISELPYLITLDLGYNNLHGTIPPSINQLTQLQIFVLNNNHLSTTLPKEIGDLSNLMYLVMPYNNMIGTIPASYGRLSRLSTLKLSNNFLTGTLPPSFGNLTSLQIFDLEINELTGTIPPELFNTLNLIKFSISSNSISGTIPNTFQQLSNLQIFLIDSNLLTGSLPNQGLFPNLTQYTIDTNFFTGHIPSFIYNCQQLQVLFVYSNQLTGRLSSQLGQLIHLTELSLFYNYITGSIPSSIGNLTQLIYIYTFKNLMTGSIPSSLGHLQHLQYLNAYSNFYTSTIPSSIGNLKNLYFIDLYDNRLTGSIPLTITNCTSLTELSLFSNKLTGTIPETIFTHKNIINALMLFDNLLTGTIPSSILNTSQISSLDLENNLFSGILPNSINNMQICMYFYLASNRFSGTLPTNIFFMERLTEFAIYENLLTGSLPQEYVYNTTEYGIAVFDVSNNYMTGNIPNSIQKIPYLFYLSVGNNYMTGSIPANILNQTVLSYLEVSNNYLTSTLPSKSLHINDQYFYLDFSNNLLTGEYPYDLYKDYFKLLYYLNLANNFLTGPFPLNIGGSYLQVLYLQNNSFTGSISMQLASGKDLSIFMASLNCLTGTIPESFCGNNNLSQLILDGLHSSNGCIDRLFDFDHDSSYGVTNGVHGTIPSCLFNMPTLKVLHMSGNNLHGSLPLEIFQYDNQTNLHSLILANNLLTGTIPSSLWTNSMVYLDLSFNRFVDSHLGDDEIIFLTHGMPSTIANLTLILRPTVRLQVNHLSGKVPSTFVHNVSSEVSIDILEGNMFVCDEERGDLPSKDPNYNTYQCGSDYTNTSLYVAMVFLSLFLVSLLYWNKFNSFERIFALVWHLGHENDRFLPQIKQKLGLRLPHLLRTSQTLEMLVRVLVILLCWTVFFLMPTYIGLSNQYGTYIHQYVWVVSSAYLSGQTPAITLLCLLLFIVAILNYLFLFSPNTLPITQFFAHHFTFAKHQYHSDFWKNDQWWYFIKLCLFICMETGVVLLVNFSYVLALNHGYNNVIITWISLAVSAFKLLWGNFMLLGMGRIFIEKYFQIQLHTAMIIVMSIFNNVVAPYLAEALVSSNCFYYAITSSPTVNTLYYDLKCSPSYACEVRYEAVSHSYDTICSFRINCDDLLQIVEDSMNYNDIQYHLSSSSYKPPFHYNYTCSSSLLSAFVYVFVYRYVLTGIIEPVIFFIIKWIQLNVQWVFEPSSFSYFASNSCSSSFNCGSIVSKDRWFAWTTNSLPVLLKFVDSLDKKQYTIQSLQQMQETLTHTINPAEKSIVRLITDITVMLSFGVLFPPLSVLIFLSLIKDMIREQYYLARLYESFLTYYNKVNTNNEVQETKEKENNQERDLEQLKNQENNLDSVTETKDSEIEEEKQMHQKISQLLLEILFRLNDMFEVWNIQFWTGWWWSGLVSVWFWSFTLYDMLAIERGPINAIWIVVVMGLSPYWIRGLWSLSVTGLNTLLSVKENNQKFQNQMSISLDEDKTNNNNNDQILSVDQNKERMTELIVPRESYQSSNSPKISFTTTNNDQDEVLIVDNPLISTLHQNNV